MDAAAQQMALDPVALRRRILVPASAMPWTTPTGQRLDSGDYAGLLPGRERDTLGFVINDQRFSDLALGAMRAARRTTGGSAEVPRHQYMMELDYGAQLGPAVRLSPNLQYIVHPDQSGAPFRPRDIPDALVLGLKFTVDAPAWLVRPAR